MADLIENERLKLTSTWLNGLSAAVFAAGVVFPLVNMAIGTIRLALGYGFILCGVCSVLTLAIHWLGGFLLGQLDVSD